MIQPYKLSICFGDIQKGRGIEKPSFLSQGL